MRVTLIHNPDSGDEAQPSGDTLLALIRAAGHEPSYQSSQGKWRDALAEPGDLVAVAGGDGTVSQVASHLMGRGVLVTVLPLGTANNISKTLELTETRLEDLIAGWSGGRRRPFDVGVVSGPWGESICLESVGVGLFARTMARLDARDNLALSHLDDADERVRSVVEMLQKRLHSAPVENLRVSADGQDISGAYILLEAMNTQYVGPNLNLAPHADPGDGFLDVVLVAKDDERKLNEYFNNWRENVACDPRLPIRRAQHLQIEWKGFEVHIDDETWPGTESSFPLTPGAIEVKVDHHALEFLLPGNSSRVV